MVVGFGMTPATYSSQQLNLADRWARAGHAVDLFTLPGQAVAAYPLPPEVRVRECPGKIIGRTGLPFMTGFQRPLRQEQYDFVLSSEHYQPVTALACLASPRVLIYQGQNIAGASRASRWLLRGLEMTGGQISRRRCLGAVAKTSQAAVFLQARGFQRVRAILCGYDEQRFGLPTPEQRRLCRAALGLAENEVGLVYAGNLLARRDVAAIIRALALLAAQGLATRLLIAGQGPEQLRLEDLARQLGVAERVNFLGLRDWSELRQIYWAGDVFVFPSRHEIFGLVLLEALACGLVLVSTPVGAAPDVVSAETGRLIPIGQPTALAQTLQDLLIDPDHLPRLTETARRVAPRYTWAASAQAILTYAQELTAHATNTA